MNIKIVFCILGVLIVAFPLNAFGAGACCNPDNSCFISNDEFDCTEGGDQRWLGDGTTCVPNPCQQPPSTVTSVPTMTEWGLIIFMVFAGLGSVYFLRRQRRA